MSAGETVIQVPQESRCIAPAFAFSKTSEGRYPAWAKLYALELGEVAASQVKAETDPTYSYAVEVAQPA